MEGGSVTITHLPKEPATRTGAIIDVNCIKTARCVILQAVIEAKEEQRFEHKAKGNVEVVNTPHTLFLVDLL